MALRTTLFPIRHLDRDDRELQVGDRVGFIMRGWFLPREQESFGLITEIDAHGGIRIQVIESYRHFTSSERVGSRESDIYFTHHVYDAEKKARVYRKPDGKFEYVIFKVDEEFPKKSE